jgi:hypothetical protein
MYLIRDDKQITFMNRIHSIINKSWIIILDIAFIVILLTMVVFGVFNHFELLFFLYGFRLVRVLLLIPYFDHVWKNIKRGLKLTGNYIASFLVILVLFSINSRILFSKENNNFSSISTSIYTNFKIILGSGFELVENLNQQFTLVVYIFLVTLIIGIIFTSTITALITDSLLQKESTDESNIKTSSPWFRKKHDENNFEFYFRVIYKIAFI